MKNLDRIQPDQIPGRISEVIEIPRSKDLMVQTRILQELLRDLESQSSPGSALFLVQTESSNEEAPQIESVDRATGLDEMDVDYLLKNSKVLIDSGEFELARNLCMKVLTTGKRNAESLHTIARTFIMENKIDLAEKALTDAIAYGASAEAYLDLSRVHLNRSRYREAADTLKRATRFEVTDSSKKYEIFKALGNCYLKTDELDSAIEAYRSALDIKEKSSEVLTNMGAAYLRMHQYVDAIECYRRAIEINPENAKAFFGLASCSMGKGDKKIAHDLLLKSLRIDINQPTAVFYLIKYAYETKTYEPSEKIVRNYIAHSAASPSLLYSLAGLQYHAKKFSEARETLAQLFEIKPDHSGGIKLRALLPVQK